MRTLQAAAFAAIIISTQSGPAHAAAAPAAPGQTAFDDKVWHTFFVAARPIAKAPAPADEYFGRYKLSFLGIRNIIHDMNIEGDSPLALPLQQGRIHEVAGSLADWANRYPRDKWLPGTTSSFVRFLERKNDAGSALLAADLIAYLNDRFATTRSGKWYAALAAAHVPVIGVDPAAVPSPFRLYGPFDPDVLNLGRGIPSQ
ncbi:MAG TPA: hypothetical protein VID19_09800 [Candidatus Eremiobacteraceae bacterium]|jgi:hypothetical protein